MALALPVLPKSVLNFATLPNPGTQEIVLADRVELLHWRELTLKVRVHSHTLTGSNTIAIKVWGMSWTPEEPGFQFPVASTTNVVTLSSSTPNPGMLSLSIPTLGAFGSGAIPGMARFTALGSRASAGSMQAALTLELSTKEA